MKADVTRREQFNAAHRLYNPEWSAEKNFEMFGPCSRIHGHNWILHVTVRGEIDPVTGFVCDLKKLKDIMKDEIVNKTDHTFLNDNPLFKDILPTTENFAMIIWDILSPIVKEKFNAEISKVKLAETENHYAEYYGG